MRWFVHFSAVVVLCLTGARAPAEPLILVAENDWYPYSAEREGVPRGISVDVVRAAYAAVGVDVQFKVMSYARCMQLLDLGEEVGCFNTPIDDLIRERQLFPEQPIDRNTAWVYAPADYPQDEIGLADLRGHTVGIVNGYRYGDAFMADAAVVREASASDLQNLKKLAAGRLDFVILYERVARYLMGRYGAQLDLKIKPVASIGAIGLYVSFSREHPAAPEARALFDEGMRRIRESGEYDAILARWNLMMDQGLSGP